MNPVPACLALILFISVQAPAQTRKLAGQARIDLLGTAAVSSLHTGRITRGDGSIDRHGWRSTTEQARSYSVHFGIARFAWTEIAFQFVPQNNGSITLTLMGPWDESKPGSGTIFLQEILWDSLRIEGSAVPNLNGSFETLSNGTISGWNGGNSITASASVPAIHGTRIARSWHDGPMSRSINVVAGNPITIKVWARAFVPASLADMRPLPNLDTPAHQAALRFMRGINFGNFLEYRPGTFNLDYTAQDYAQARSEGFDHVRLPVAWHLYVAAAPEFRIADSILSRVDTALELASRNQLGLILDWHHFESFMASPTDHETQFYAVWRQIAERYAAKPASVAFELLNEPLGAATTPVLNRIYAQALQQIRASNPTRTIFVGPGKANSADELQSLLLPDSDPNLIATVHIYDPFLFTHQGASWAGPDVATVGVSFPGPPLTPLQRSSRTQSTWVSTWFDSYNNDPPELNPGGSAAFRGKIQRLGQWSNHFKRPVHVGEFGAYETASPASRVSYSREIRKAMDEHGIGWAMWDWKAGFHYFQSGQPSPPGMRDALFPPFHLSILAPNTIACEAAVGKTVTLERTLSLSPPSWQPVKSETLRSPRFIFEVAPPTAQPATFYRLRWDK